MKVEIRRATVEDATAIADIIHSVFQNGIDLRRIQTQLLLSNTMIDVAIVDHQVVGFVENFVTCSDVNSLRLELDLLAVDPSQQGQGVGRKLIETTVSLMHQLGTTSLRALIATTNIPMHYLCKTYRFIQDDHECGLYTLPVDGDLVSKISEIKSHMTQVNTLTYDGVWLESRLSQRAISNACYLVHQRNLDIVGVVCSKQDNDGIQLLNDNDFQHVGDYHRWTLNL